uniref:Protein phosphatase 1 regulatory subunit 35 n=1 Tax=Oryctolagus cuniculus TaxID=9986 RepID=G1TKY6_RABIT
MLGCGESELESVEGDEAVVAPGLPPEPRAPEPRAPLPEPGLDLSLSPRPESPEPRSGSPRRPKGQAERRGGARRGRQVRFCLAPLSPARPEALRELEHSALHSSLALGLESTSAKAVEEQLRKSFPASLRCGRTALSLNVPRSRRLFRDLVSLQVPEEQVLNAALREKLALLPPQARVPPPKEPPGPGPDMTILCDPETLVYEAPHLPLDGLPPLRLQPRRRPPEDTFLMHRTLRRWEA